MIGVTVICIGKLKEKFFSDACSEYQKRLSKFCSLSVIELNEYKLSDNPSEAEIENALENEGKNIIANIPKGAYLVTLCIEGKELSSVEFSEKIEKEALNGKGKICFVIGSSFGISKTVKDMSDFKLSFSKMTFPHMLFRVLLLEQIYRAFSISGGMKYHK